MKLFNMITFLFCLINGANGAKPTDQYKDVPVIRNAKPTDIYKDVPVIRNAKPTDIYKDTPLIRGRL